MTRIRRRLQSVREAAVIAILASAGREKGARRLLSGEGRPAADPARLAMSGLSIAFLSGNLRNTF